MLEKELGAIKREFDETEARLASGGLSSGDIEKLSRRHSACRQILETAAVLEKAEKEAEGTRQMVSSTDKEMAELAASELPALEGKAASLAKKLNLLIIPPDPSDPKNIFLEIRAGVGGDESALFAADLLRMYTRFAQSIGLKAELRDLSATGLKGIKYAVLYVSGQDAYSWFKYEGGVHRVQRVPQTEASGRVHTSTVTVAIMTEIDEVEIKINPKDLKMDTYRSGGSRRAERQQSGDRRTHHSHPHRSYYAMPAGAFAGPEQDEGHGAAGRQTRADEFGEPG